MANETSEKSQRKRSWKYWLLVFYLPLLVVSTVVRLTLPPEGELSSGQQRIEIHEYNQDTPTGESVRIAFRDLPAIDGNPQASVVVMIHGSPVGSQALNKLLPELNQEFRLVVPDLPGFGGSTIEITDYSTRAAAHYVLQLMDRLGITKAYFCGYSMGGGVILNIAEIAPERVEGLIMGAAIGVQEYELLGSYSLNHGIHGLQLGALWGLQNFVPHFGLMDHGILNVAYARNFFDTDQRPFRRIIEDYTGPMLIVHGTEDTLVPPMAAIEHAKIAQQAELQWKKGGHMEILMKPKAYTDAMQDFVKRVEAGNFAGQSYDPSMTPAAVKEPGYGFIVVLLSLGTLVSEDLSCIIAGLLASQGTMPLWAAIVACAAGIFFGDLLLYLAGYFLGKPALGRAPLKWMVTPATVERMGLWYHKRGAVIILISRFVPGTRLPAYVAAGVLRVPLRKFLPYFALAVILWTPVLVGLSYLAGDIVLRWVERYDRFAIWILLSLILALWMIIHWVVPMFTWSGRRKLLGRWLRLTRWEYWPLWAVYIPVGLYITFTGLIKYGRASLFTAVNPGIPNGGGLVNESKSQILGGLADAGDSIAAWRLLPLQKTAEENWLQVEQFMHLEGYTLPVVLKPDLGERGEGVAIIRSKEQGLDYLRRAIDNTIVQEFIPGLEYGVFYYRFPSEPQGHILGITDKQFPVVTGDGVRTIEELILADKRAIAMDRFFLQKFEDRLDEVPADGESLALSELGTHCRGSEFLDASDLATPELLASLDTISDSFEGFDFGRYDIRVPNQEDLVAGRNLKVIELNGLTSEATYIYDPRYGYFDGLGVLFKQWRICFRIAAENVANGHPSLSAMEVFRLFFQYRSRERLEA